MKKYASGFLALVLCTVVVVAVGLSLPSEHQSASASSHQAQNNDCQAEPHLISEAIAPQEVAVYALDDAQSNQLGTFAATAHIDVIGRNFDGAWLVVEWNDDIVGWVQLDDVEIVACDNVNTPTDPNMPTAEPPTN